MPRTRIDNPFGVDGEWHDRLIARSTDNKTYYTEPYRAQYLSTADFDAAQDAALRHSGSESRRMNDNVPGEFAALLRASNGTTINPSEVLRGRPAHTSKEQPHKAPPATQNGKSPPTPAVDVKSVAGTTEVIESLADRIDSHATASAVTLPDLPVDRSDTPVSFSTPHLTQAKALKKPKSLASSRAGSVDPAIPKQRHDTPKRLREGTQSDSVQIGANGGDNLIYPAVPKETMPHLQDISDMRAPTKDISDNRGDHGRITSPMSSNASNEFATHPTPRETTKVSLEGASGPQVDQHRYNRNTPELLSENRFSGKRQTSEPEMTPNLQSFITSGATQAGAERKDSVVPQPKDDGAKAVSAHSSLSSNTITSHQGMAPATIAGIKRPSSSPDRSHASPVSTPPAMDFNNAASPLLDFTKTAQQAGTMGIAARENNRPLSPSVRTSPQGTITASQTQPYLNLADNPIPSTEHAPVSKKPRRSRGNDLTISANPLLGGTAAAKVETWYESTNGKIYKYNGDEPEEWVIRMFDKTIGAVDPKSGRRGSSIGGSSTPRRETPVRSSSRRVK